MMFGRGNLGNYTCSRYLGAPMGMGWIMPIVFIILIIVTAIIIYSLVKKSKENPNQALEILKTRFVSGEISEEEYSKKRQILNK